MDEPFGPLVKDWRDGSPGKERRLESLLEMLAIRESDAADLRYQLFHARRPPCWRLSAIGLPSR